MEDSASAANRLANKSFGYQSDIPRGEPTGAKLGPDDQDDKVVLMGPRATGCRRINGEGWGRGVSSGARRLLR